MVRFKVKLNALYKTKEVIIVEEFYLQNQQKTRDPVFLELIDLYGHFENNQEIEAFTSALALINPFPILDKDTMFSVIKEIPEKESLEKSLQEHYDKYAEEIFAQYVDVFFKSFWFLNEKGTKKSRMEYIRNLLLVVIRIIDRQKEIPI